MNVTNCWPTKPSRGIIFESVFLGDFQITVQCQVLYFAAVYFTPIKRFIRTQQERNIYDLYQFIPSHLDAGCSKVAHLIARRRIYDVPPYIKITHYNEAEEVFSGSKVNAVSYFNFIVFKGFWPLLWYNLIEENWELSYNATRLKLKGLFPIFH